jgi:hypothetical protein
MKAGLCFPGETATWQHGCLGEAQGIEASANAAHLFLDFAMQTPDILGC